ncbi:BPSS1996 family virulence factor [Paraburkholderia jirisanensis]
MNAKSLIGLSLIALSSFGFVTAASAQGLTRAEVRAELVQAENNGSRFVADASYPDVSPIFTQQVARLKKQHSDSDVGGTSQGTTQSGMRSAMTSVSMSNACVGPRSYCDLYAGS